MEIWFLSDTHFDHDNLIKHGARKGFINSSEADDCMADNIRKKVKQGDMVYFVGDFAMWHHDDIFQGYKFPGNWCILRGNHDKGWKAKAQYPTIKDIMIEDQKITLCHYPMYSFNCSHWNAWQIYGHHHTDVSHIVTGKRMNVCVDLHNFSPVSWEQVKEYMKNRPDNWDLIKR